MSSTDEILKWEGLGEFERQSKGGGQMESMLACDGAGDRLTATVKCRGFYSKGSGEPLKIFKQG